MYAVSLRVQVKCTQKNPYRLRILLNLVYKWYTISTVDFQFLEPFWSVDRQTLTRMHCVSNVLVPNGVDLRSTTSQYLTLPEIFSVGARTFLCHCKVALATKI